MQCQLHILPEPVVNAEQFLLVGLGTEADIEATDNLGQSLYLRLDPVADFLHHLHRWHDFVVKRYQLRVESELLSMLSQRKQLMLRGCLFDKNLELCDVRGVILKSRSSLSLPLTQVSEALSILRCLPTELELGHKV